MPYFDPGSRPIPGRPSALPPSPAPPQAVPIEPKETPKTRATSPRYRTYREKDKQRMLDTIDPKTYEPDAREVADRLLRGGPQ